MTVAELRERIEPIADKLRESKNSKERRFLAFQIGQLLRERRKPSTLLSPISN